MNKTLRKSAQIHVGTVLLAQHKYLSAVYTIAQIFWCGVNKHPALLLEALPHNIGVTSLVCLLPSCYSKGNLSLGVFGYFEKAAIMSLWLAL